jgi:hypothetical protein
LNAVFFEIINIEEGPEWVCSGHAVPAPGGFGDSSSYLGAVARAPE